MDFIEITSGVTSNGMHLAEVPAFVSSGGIAEDYVVGDGGEMYLFNGGSALAGSVFDGGLAVVSSGAVSSDTQVHWGGYMQIEKGGISEGADVMYGGILGVAPGGTAKKASVGTGGLLGVSSGGNANGTEVNNGYFEIASGGTATSTNASAGFIVNRGGTAMLTTLDSGSHLYLDQGAFANITTVKGGSFMWVGKNSGAFSTTVENARLAVGDGGNTSGTVISSGGEAMVAQGAVMEDTTVKTGGSLYAWEDGTLDSVTAENGASIYVGCGAELTGTVTLNEGASLYADFGSVIHFDLEEAKAGDKALINDYSLVKGMPNYVITVSADMADGDYVLADNVSDFNAVVYVQDSEYGELGFISTGFDLYTWDKNYSLSVVDDSLILTVDSTGRNWSDYYTGGADGAAFEKKAAESIDKMREFFEERIASGEPVSGFDKVTLPEDMKIFGQGGGFFPGTGGSADNFASPGELYDQWLEGVQDFFTALKENHRFRQGGFFDLPEFAKDEKNKDMLAPGWSDLS